MKSWWAVGWMISCAIGAAQEPAQQPAQHTETTPATKEELLAELAEGGIEVDLEKRTITIPTVVNDPADPLEYLVVHPHGKQHEALLMSEVKPSLLNTAFLLLGFDKGENAKFVPIEPPPTEEEIMKGAEIARLIPPQGMPLWMTVRWRTDDGKEHEAPIEDWLLDLTTEKPMVDASWVYLGGEMGALYRGEPEVFVADYEGNMVSTCYMAPANHLVTIVHPRARSDENVWYTDARPPVGTKVQLRFWATEPALVLEREKRLSKPPAADSDGNGH